MQRSKSNNLYEYDIDIKELILKSLSILGKHKVLIFLSLSAGILLGIAYFFRTKLIYKSEMVLSANSHDTDHGNYDVDHLFLILPRRGTFSYRFSHLDGLLIQMYKINSI